MKLYTYLQQSLSANGKCHKKYHVLSISSRFSGLYCCFSRTFSRIRGNYDIFNVILHSIFAERLY